MRFDDEAHIAAWERNRTYPAIHRPMCETVVNFACGVRFLDLCCSHGLIGQFLADQGFAVVGVDGSARAIARAEAAGIAIPLVHIRITRETAGAVMDLIADHRLTGIVARRTLPELFDRDLEFGRDFFRQAHAAGIHEVFLEGRIATRKATSALASIDAEVHLLQPTFAQARRWRNVAHMLAGHDAG
jgi:SAM-dependent methyltransferase